MKRKTMSKESKRRIDLPSADGKTPEEILASIAVSGTYASSLTAKAFADSLFAKENETDFGAILGVVADISNRAAKNDLSNLERMLAAQAVALDAVFNNMARRAAANLSKHTAATEIYMRMAFKAQSQCRTTVETLAEIKNPRSVAFVRQANIAQGHQQVNNGGAGTEVAGEKKIIESSNELLEHQNGERLDTRTKSAAVGIDQAMATVVEINRPSKRVRKSPISPE